MSEPRINKRQMLKPLKRFLAQRAFCTGLKSGVNEMFRSLAESLARFCSPVKFRSHVKIFGSFAKKIFTAFMEISLTPRFSAVLETNEERKIVLTVFRAAEGQR